MKWMWKDLMIFAWTVTLCLSKRCSSGRQVAVFAWLPTSSTITKSTCPWRICSRMSRCERGCGSSVSTLGRMRFQTMRRIIRIRTRFDDGDWDHCNGEDQLDVKEEMNDVMEKQQRIRMLQESSSPTNASSDSKASDSGPRSSIPAHDDDAVSRTSTVASAPVFSQQHAISSADPYHVNDAAQADCLERFARDVSIVLCELRAEPNDPTLPPLWRDSPSQERRRRLLPTFTRTWTWEDWHRHRRRRRYWDYLITFPSSRLLRRVAPQFMFILSWSAFVCWAFAQQALMVPTARSLISRKANPVTLLSHGVTKSTVPLHALSLVSTLLAALLTLRSNQGLQRLNEGRMAFGKVVLYTRDMAQSLAAHVYPDHPTLALKAARHVALFAWLLRHFLREPPTAPITSGQPYYDYANDEDIIRAMLDPEDADYVLAQRKRPVAVVTRLRQIFSHLHRSGKLTTSEASRLDHTVQQLNHSIMVTERIRASPIPPLYTAHTGRLLLFYLLFLPLALRGSGMLLSSGMTMLITAVCTYTMFGLDEISHLLEEPFRLMPLWHLSKNSMMDVADAMLCQPPPLSPPLQ